MKKLLPLLALGLLAGCSTVLETGDRIERGLTPPDAVNYVTTKADGTFETQINDHRIAGKLALLAARAAPADEEPRMEPSGYVNKDSAGQSNMYPVITRAYEAKVTPHCFVIDGKGTLVYKGAIDSISSAKSADIEKATNYVLAAVKAATYRLTGAYAIAVTVATLGWPLWLALIFGILGAVIFKEQPGVFSDACNKAIQFGKPMLMRDDWKRVFEPDEIAASIKRIT